MCVAWLVVGGIWWSEEVVCVASISRAGLVCVCVVVNRGHVDPCCSW